MQLQGSNGWLWDLQPRYALSLNGLYPISVQLKEKWHCSGSNIYILLVAPFVRGLDPLFDPFCIWGNEVTMTINQVKKLRKIVRIKKLATKDTKLFVCTMKKTSVCYKMVLIYLPTIFFICTQFQYWEMIFMPIFVFSLFWSSSLMITSQPTCMVKRQERFLYNTHAIILKSSWRGRTMDGQSSTVAGLKSHRRSTFS